MKQSNRLLSSVKGAILFFVLIVALSCTREKEVTLNFAFGPTEAPNVQPLIDQFNKMHKGEIKVQWKKTNVLSDKYYRQLEEDFKSGKNSYDVIGSDVVWTATMAKNNWVKDLSSSFYQDYQPEKFVDASLNSVIYDFKVWGIPWYTDAGILFYRKDLLEKSGFQHPPATWEELKTMAKKVQAESDIKYGYVFQGANYEGGVANACEFIWNAGGNVLLSNLAVSGQVGDIEIAPDVVIVDSKESEAGLQEARRLIDEGIAPAEVAGFKESECTEAFINGEALFMRGWPGIYYFLKDKKSRVKPEQVGLSSIPVSRQGAPSFSCLGGWNLMVAAHVPEEKQKAAWTFIQYMTAPEQQKFRALQGGILPSLSPLYDDEQLLEEVPTMALAKEVIKNTRVRPVSPNYMSFSPKISNIYNQVLTGQIPPEYAVSYLQMELEMVAQQE